MNADGDTVSAIDANVYMSNYPIKYMSNLNVGAG